MLIGTKNQSTLALKTQPWAVDFQTSIEVCSYFFIKIFCNYKRHSADDVLGNYFWTNIAWDTNLLESARVAKEVHSY